MEREGFRNYAMEWWHFTLANVSVPDVIYDVPVE
jgi:D-alanyl-D-alanine dipeptidase